MKNANLPRAFCFFALSLIASQDALAQGKLQYNRDIRPILAENCFACHGPDSASRKAGLRLDHRETAIEAGAITPNKPGDSDMIRRIHAANKEHMPPLATKKVLTKSEMDKLQRWIAEGAEYQKHWSLIAPTRPPLPAVKNIGWVRNPIDRFILAKLEEKGLTPAPEADRRTLARRLSLDLTGLPPEPADVEAFVNDKSPEYYEKFVDKLMESPHWGEHRGRYWLDAARYADTHGIHFDNFREIWAYRDWVIKAFNKNMKFDEFTIEQLAGDLLPHRTLDQQIASGFNRCNITTNEGGAINEEYLVLYARDRTETVAQVWLGSTMGCCVCHDHKFDPFTHARFLFDVGLVQQYDAAGDGWQHQGHAAHDLRAARRGPAEVPRDRARHGRRSPATGGAQESRTRRIRQVGKVGQAGIARNPDPDAWLAKRRRVE